MAQTTVEAAKLTTDQAIHKLFPERVIETAKQVAAESDANAQTSTDEDASR